jgi:hypothetical protein
LFTGLLYHAAFPVPGVKFHILFNFNKKAYHHSDTEMEGIMVKVNEQVNFAQNRLRRLREWVHVKLYFFLNSALDVGRWSKPWPGSFVLGKQTRCPVYRRRCEPHSRAGTGWFVSLLKEFYIKHGYEVVQRHL